MSGIAIRSGNASPFRVGSFGVDPATQDVMDILFDGNSAPLRLMQRSTVYLTGSGYPELRADWNVISTFALANPAPAGQYPLFLCAAKAPTGGSYEACANVPNGFGAGTGNSFGFGMFFSHSQPLIQPDGSEGPLIVPATYVSVLVFRNRF